MPQPRHAGRHRTRGRVTPLTELSTVLARTSTTGLKASAVVAATGGLAAAVALPAVAAPQGSEAIAARAARGQVAAPAARAIAAPAVVAPAASAAPSVDRRVVTPAFGVVGVKAVAKPKPKPKPRPVAAPVRERATQQATSSSRTTNRDATPRRVTRSSQRATAAPSASAPKVLKVAQSASGIVNIARNLLGIPYRYGGSTPAGFDCSGFTQYVYGKAGVSIPRTSGAQQSAATRVSNPRPGDLVFFGSPAYHVGIYVSPGRMIDSPRTGKSTSERAIFSSNVSYGRF